MRHRNMYYLTGQPGWMRFGCSPGWVGRSPSGLGPCAQFLMSGQQPLADQHPRLEFLKNQASFLEQQLAAIKSQIETLEGEQNQ
ncbi:MAG TPA: DUF5320 domain-containing protein [Armatimonadota bacterium]|nr:DUF5320 domain-containing protein [Armatimonadota bacterium]